MDGEYIYDFEDGSAVATQEQAFREAYVKRFMSANPLTECSFDDANYTMMWWCGGTVLVLYGLLLQAWVAWHLSKVIF